MEVLLSKEFNSGDNDLDVEECGKWMNDNEIEQIKIHDTYHNGLNNTPGGQHDKESSFSMHSHKLSLKYYDKFVEYINEYIDITGQTLSECDTFYTTSDGKLLCQHISRFRRKHSYLTVKSDRTKMKKLYDLGYIDKSTNELKKYKNKKTRIAKRWKYLEAILDSIYSIYDHINIPQNTIIIPGVPCELLDELNYTTFGSVFRDIRKGKLIPDYVDIKKKYNYFDTHDDFKKHKFKIGLEWYYDNHKYSYPRSGFIVNDKNLPKFMENYKLGLMFNLWKNRDNFTDEIKLLIEKNKHKPKETQNEKFKNDPEYYNEWKKRVSEGMSNMPEKAKLVSKYKTLIGRLNRGVQKASDNTNRYVPESLELPNKKRKVKYFKIDDYKNEEERTKARNLYRYQAFYLRKLYVLSQYRKLINMD